MTDLPSRLRASAQEMRSLESIVRVAQRIAAELEQAADALEAGPWLPIEAAPKDGRHILVSDGVRVSIGGWLTDIDHGAEWEGQIGMAGWWAVDLGPNNDRPTLWAPLPAAPAAQVAPDAPSFTDQQMCDAVPESATLLEPLKGPGKVCMTRLELRAFAENLLRTVGVETAAQLNTDGVPEIVPEVAFRTKGDAATSGAGALMANAAPLAGSNPAAIHPHGVAEFMAGLDTAPKGRGFTGQRPDGVPGAGKDHP